MLRLASFLLLAVAISINLYFSSRSSTMSSSPPPSTSSERTKFYLFGNPIQHSLSPTFHNTLFSSLSLPNHSYTIHESPSFSSDPSTLTLLRSSPTFGGAAVTMPHKLSALSFMDHLGPEVTTIGSMNTIVHLSDGKLVGRNTDVLGIRNALLSTLPTSTGERTKDFPWGKGGNGVVIGGGGTTRAAIYALDKLGFSPIYLINRDSRETKQIIESFPQYELVALEHEGRWGKEESEKCRVVVGAIPSLEPQTEGERMVYKVAEKVFEMGGAEESGEEKVFLDMAYKPHVTRMIELARKYNWTTVGGIEALVHQAFAQQQYWLLDPEASTYNAEIAEGKRLTEEVFERAAEEVRRKAGVPLLSIA